MKNVRFLYFFFRRAFGNLENKKKMTNLHAQETFLISLLHIEDFFYIVFAHKISILINQNKN